MYNFGELVKSLWDNHVVTKEKELLDYKKIESYSEEARKLVLSKMEKFLLEIEKLKTEYIGIPIKTEIIEKIAEKLK